MALIRIRHAYCDIGHVCPALTVDTDTRDPETGTCGAIISGPVDLIATKALGLPAGEVAIRLTAREVPEMLHNLGPDHFTGEVPR